MAGEYEEVLRKLDALTATVQDVRERMIRVETHDYPNRLDRLEQSHDKHGDRLTIIETRGQVFSAGIAAAVSLIVSVAGALAGYIFGKS